MIFKNNSYKLDRNQKLLQSYKYVANSIIEIKNTNSYNVIGISSSLNYKESKYIAVKNVYNQLIDKGLDALLINAELEPESNSLVNKKGKIWEFKNLNVNDMKNIILEEKEKRDLILINIPPILIMADALEYSKLCDSIILLERYSYSKYRDYENTIAQLNDNNINISGVITYR